METVENIFYVSGKIYDLECPHNNLYHRWFGEKVSLVFSKPITKLKLYYSLINDKSTITINDIELKNLKSSGIVETEFKNPVEHVIFESPTFCPSKLYKTSDCRDLGIFVYSIEYIDIYNKKYSLNIDDWKVLDETLKLLIGSKNTQNNVYYHSGDLGDILQSLVIIKNTGGGTLYIGPDIKVPEERFHPREKINFKTFEFLKSLLEAQSYIKNVFYTEKYPENVTHDLNKFRTFYFKTHNEFGFWPNGTNINLLDASLNIFELDTSLKNSKWLFVKNKIVYNKKIIINKTLRVNNFSEEIESSYKYLVTNFSNFCVFVGLEEEYNNFVEKYGYIEYIKINDAYELAQIINQCYIFIGNTSFPIWIAESLKKDIFVETPESGVKHGYFLREGVQKLNKSSTSEIKIPKIYHVVALYEPRSVDVKQRMEIAKKTWEELYKKDNIIPVHLYEKDYPRTTLELGDDRKCPFLLDLIRLGYQKCESDDDIVMITNDDTILSPYISSKIYEKIRKYESCKSFRVNLRYYNNYNDIGLHNMIAKDGGRDMFAMTKRWIKHNIGLIPDYALGTTDWDLGISILIQFTNGIYVSKVKNENDCETDIDIGHVFHVNHKAEWRKLRTINNYNAQLTKNLIKRLEVDSRFLNMEHDRYE